MKIVVFDLDETLGCFTQFGIFWDSLQKFLIFNQNYKLSQNDFNETLDLFPKFLRPNILQILQYLKHKKKTNCCRKLMIYTNNTGPKEWAQHIKDYFESKIHYKLIDQIIAAFKINGQRVELCRTSYEKKHHDLIRCSKLPIDSEICFLDDTFYPHMSNEKIYYINLKPYYYDYDFDDMITIFKKSNIGKALLKNVTDTESKFQNVMKEHINQYNYKYIKKTEEEYDIDVILGKYILTHLQTFFNDNKIVKTKKNNVYKNNKTKRK
jgi:hypothetical protein